MLEVWRGLPEQAAGEEALLDGEALMRLTGLGPGQRLGRLKEWLWRVQIERDLASAAQVQALLEELPWRDQNPSSWPRVAL